eukprot:1160641-Pelagomonas_calceolata.AAC.2
MACTSYKFRVACSGFAQHTAIFAPRVIDQLPNLAKAVWELQQPSKSPLVVNKSHLLASVWARATWLA